MWVVLRSFWLRNSAKPGLPRFCCVLLPRGVASRPGPHGPDPGAPETARARLSMGPGKPGAGTSGGAGALHIHRDHHSTRRDDSGRAPLLSFFGKYLARFFENFGMFPRFPRTQVRI